MDRLCLTVGQALKYPVVPLPQPAVDYNAVPCPQRDQLGGAAGTAEVAADQHLERFHGEPLGERLPLGQALRVQRTVQMTLDFGLRDSKQFLRGGPE